MALTAALSQWASVARRLDLVTRELREGRPG
jgi:hypothetical protein